LKDTIKASGLRIGFFENFEKIAKLKEIEKIQGIRKHILGKLEK